MYPPTSAMKAFLSYIMYWNGMKCFMMTNAIAHGSGGHLPAPEVHALHSVDIGQASVLSGPYGHNTHIPCYQVE